MSNIDPFIIQACIFVDYGSMLIRSGETNISGGENYFATQRNGLLGGAIYSRLSVHLGVHTGEVHVEVERHQQPPAIDESWEEIVEVSCYIDAAPVVLEGASPKHSLRLPLEKGWFRVRLCVVGFGESEKARIFDDPKLERYKLIFWAADPRGDAILKQTSDEVIHRHRFIAADAGFTAD
jgi:hypothetical protein